jgi:multiple sugar transport system ATP-binding protein
MIAGLESITSGEMEVDGQRFNNVPAARRGVAMVFQNYALYPHMTVFGNMSYGLRIAGTPKAEIDRKVRAAADMLQITPFLDRRPAQLSGGQRQRVAIGRAIVREPAAFLFDEPLSNLDAALRSDTRLEIARLHKALGATMIYVTHDQVEAMTLADRIVVLKDGQIMQDGSPRDLYETPQNLFVAQFIGSPRMNLIPCRMKDAVVVLPDGTRVNPGRSLTRPAAHMGLRPEHLHLAAPDSGMIAGRIGANEYVGSDNSVFVDAGALGRINLRAPGDQKLREGQEVGISFDRATAHFFAADGGRV